MSKIKDGSYITIQDFMVRDLRLTGNSLLIYAIIFGFSQDGETEFSGSLQYLADWCGSSRQSVQKCLKTMCENGILHKETSTKKGVLFVTYTAKRGCTTKLHTVQQSCLGCTTKLLGGVQQSCTNKLIDKLEDNIIAARQPPPDPVFSAWASIQPNGKCGEKMQANINGYRAKGCDDDLILYAIEKMQEASSTNWGYCKKILDDAVANGKKTKAEFIINKGYRGGGHNVAVTRGNQLGALGVRDVGKRRERLGLKKGAGNDTVREDTATP